MKVRSIFLAILLTMLLILAACKKEESNLIIGDQCPEGTTPMVVIDSDGLSSIECVPTE
jgi:hypothetical protein